MIQLAEEMFRLRERQMSMTFYVWGRSIPDERSALS